jgi:hypothetical protein
MDEERTELEDEGIPDHGGRTSGDPDERAVPPSDEPQADGTTAGEQRAGPSLDERLEAETTDDPRAPHGHELAEPTEGPIDDEKDLVAEETEEAAGAGAEEQAVRVDDEAPGGTSGPDRYVEEEPSEAEDLTE